MDGIEREMGLIAEMALGAQDLHAFERQWFERLQPSLGFETACSVWTASDGKVLDVVAIGYDEAGMRDRFPVYMGELSQAEVVGFSAVEPAIDTDVVSRPRRERLTVYRELLRPIQVSSFVTNVWRSRWGVFGFHFARTRHACDFTRRETEWLGRVVPCVKLGQALFATEATFSLARGEPDWWARAWGLSPREQETARLVARGFCNPEIAVLLRVSRHTIRNHLACIFRKADVSSRAELVFAMTSPPEQEGRRRKHRRHEGEAWHAFVAAEATR